MGHVLGGTRSENGTVRKDVGTVSDRKGFADVVIGDQDAHTPITKHLDELLKVGHGQGIDPGKRFIQQEISRSLKTDGKGTGDFTTTAFPTRELITTAVQERTEVKVINQLMQALATLRAGETALCQNQFQVLPHRELTENTRFLRQITNTESRPLWHRQTGDRVTIEKDLTTVRTQESDHQIEGGGLASAIRSKQADHLARIKGDGEVTNQRPATKGEGHPFQGETHGVNGV